MATKTRPVVKPPTHKGAPHHRSAKSPTRPAKPQTKPIQAVMSVRGYGAVSLHVTSLTYGVHVISTESEARASRAMYVTAVTQDSFGLSLVFPTYAEYAHLGDFIEGYGHRLAAGTLLAPARVQIPKFGFDRTGIPSGVPRGDNVETVAYRMQIGFVGARDLVASMTNDVTVVSNVIGAEYLNAIHHDAQAAYYYPSGTQFAGTGYGTDTLYDDASRAIPALDNGQADPNAQQYDTQPNGKRVLS